MNTLQQQWSAHKFTKKYEEGGELVTKTVTISYEGSRVKVTTKKSTNHQIVLDDIEYVVENGYS
jgi:hypothetical protein